MKNACACLSVIVLFGLMPIHNDAFAEQSVEFDNYVVLYSAVLADSLPKAVADAHNIKRSRGRMVLTIVVQEKGDTASPKPVPAIVTARAHNLLGQIKDIKMRPVREGDAIYYIGESKIVDEETLSFSVDIRPENSVASHNLQFQQQFFLK